jgi:hypothetical protein
MEGYEIFAWMFFGGIMLMIGGMAVTTYQYYETCNSVGLPMAQSQADVPSGYARCVVVENETLQYKMVRR